MVARGSSPLQIVTTAPGMEKFGEIERSIPGVMARPPRIASIVAAWERVIVIQMR
jgi:hypothetical protein